MIDQVTNAGALPVLERLVQFAGQRQRLIAHNIANLDTPHFRPVDVSVDGFQTQLGEAIDRRRVDRDALHLRSSDEVAVAAGGVQLNPKPIGDNILFHDGNDRDPERMMQGLVENFMTFRTAAELMKSRFDLINVAIRERI